MKDILARTFQVDVTPPVGGYLCGGLHKTSLGVETPLSLRGTILEQGGERFVVAAVEFCYLCGRSHDRMIAALGEAAATGADRVTLQSVHTHDAPLIYEEAHALIAEPRVHDEAYFVSVIDRTKAAVRDALSRPATRVGGVRFTSHRVHEFASTRRVIDQHNRCHIRYSKCQDPAIKPAPEGKIDPMLDQVVWHDAEGKPFTCWSFYASHPQVSDGRRLISGDTTGVALELFEKTNPGVFPIYFTGCGGDVTAGKYTTTNPHRDRLVFGVRLFEAMQGAFASPGEATPLRSIEWRDAAFEMPLRTEEHGASHFEATLADPAAALSSKYLAAIKLHKLRRGKPTYPFRLSRLALDGSSVLFLPTELVVEYQLHAKSLAPGRVAVAAYGDSFLNYVATDEAFDQGGYEVDPEWTEVDRGCEGPIKAAIESILR